jgi:hypothetical protein
LAKTPAAEAANGGGVTTAFGQAELSAGVLIPTRVRDRSTPPRRANGSTPRGGIAADRWVPRGNNFSI